MDNLGSSNMSNKNLNQAEFLMSSLKQLIEKQNSENKILQENNCSLQKENKLLCDKNTELITQIKNFEMGNIQMAEEKLKLKDKIKALEENLEFKNAELQSINKHFCLDQSTEKDETSYNNDNDSPENISSNSLVDDLNEVKVEPEDFHDSSVDASKDNEITPNNFQLLQCFDKCPYNRSGIEKTRANIGIDDRGNQSAKKIQSHNIIDQNAQEVAETLDSNSKEDSLGQIESDSTEVLNLHSDNEFFTTVDNNSKEPAEKNARPAQKSKEKLFECPKCAKKFATQGGLHIHTNIHDKSHQCEVCLKCFGTKYVLTLHMRTHTGEKPYACATCGKKFARKDYLQHHRSSHSGGGRREKRFKCEICPDERYFRTKGELKKHAKYHYEPELACVKCGKKCYNSGDLTEHMKIHFEPTYPCKNCDKKFHTMSGLRKHERSKKGCNCTTEF